MTQHDWSSMSERVEADKASRKFRKKFKRQRRLIRARIAFMSFMDGNWRGVGFAVIWFTIAIIFIANGGLKVTFGSHPELERRLDALEREHR